MLYYNSVIVPRINIRRKASNNALKSANKTKMRTSIIVLFFIIVMLTKCRIPQSKKILALPLIPVGIAILYVVMNCMHEQFITSIFNDIAVFDCLVFTAFFESCIQCGLIQSNTGYPELFHASVCCSVQIADKK